MPTSMQQGRTRHYIKHYISGYCIVIVQKLQCNLQVLVDDRDASCTSAMANWIVADLVLNRVLNRSKDSMASLACSICLSHVHNLAVAVSVR